MTKHFFFKFPLFLLRDRAFPIEHFWILAYTVMSFTCKFFSLQYFYSSRSMSFWQTTRKDFFYSNVAYIGDFRVEKN